MCRGKSESSARRHWTGVTDGSLVIVGVSVGYAALLANLRRYERRVASTLAQTPMTGYAAVDDQTAAKVGM